MKTISKITAIATSLTPAQGEAALNTILADGWTLVGVFTVGSSKFWAVFTKTISN